MGQKEGTIKIDFSKLKDSDDKADSKFEVAGRMYYEAHVFGYMVSSFTSSGYVDRLGYEVEPLSSSSLDIIKNTSAITLLTFAFIAYKSY